mmetsp:Transcript_597/g.1870  ORF Transcript_597/g.1870 Transcript_597/m.1870 type:complete len:347 (+) Transcript_597:295-1335(+)
MLLARDPMVLLGCFREVQLAMLVHLVVLQINLYFDGGLLDMLVPEPLDFIQMLVNVVLLRSLDLVLDGGLVAAGVADFGRDHAGLVAGRAFVAGVADLGLFRGHLRMDVADDIIAHLPAAHAWPDVPLLHQKICGGDPILLEHEHEAAPVDAGVHLEVIAVSRIVQAQIVPTVHEDVLWHVHGVHPAPLDELPSVDWLAVCAQDLHRDAKVSEVYIRDAARGASRRDKNVIRLDVPVDEPLLVHAVQLRCEFPKQSFARGPALPGTIRIFFEPLGEVRAARDHLHDEAVRVQRPLLLSDALNVTGARRGVDQLHSASTLTHGLHVAHLLHKIVTDGSGGEHRLHCE